MIKQVLVVRKDLHMKMGKIAAQSAHASMKVLLDLMISTETSIGKDYLLALSSEEPLFKWLEGAFTKVCVYVNSEEELLSLQKQAQDAGILNALITDSGKTEFHGVPTNTVLAIGPDDSEKINKITGHLKLL